MPGFIRTHAPASFKLEADHHGLSRRRLSSRKFWWYTRTTPESSRTTLNFRVRGEGKTPIPSPTGDNRDDVERVFFI